MDSTNSHQWLKSDLILEKNTVTKKRIGARSPDNRIVEGCDNISANGVLGKAAIEKCLQCLDCYKQLCCMTGVEAHTSIHSKGVLGIWD